MRELFYYSKNIIGLILVISPLCGCLLINHPFTLSMVMLGSSLFGISLSCSLYELVNFKLWTGLYCMLYCGGCYLMLCRPEAAAAVIGAILTGLVAGGFLLLLPANMMIHWFRASKARVLGISWSSAVALGWLWKLAMERFTYAALGIALAAALIGVLFFLERPPALLIPDQLESSLPDQPHVSRLRQRTTRKTWFFFFALSLNVGIIFYLAPVDMQFILSPENRFWPWFLLGLAAGPLAAGSFIEKKGSFSCSVLLIFLVQGSMLFLGTAFQTFSLHWIGYAMLGTSISMTAVVVPILVYYLFSPGEFSVRLTYTVFALPAGLLIAFACAVTGIFDALPPQDVSTIAMIALTIGFFTIFSAWKHRLVLLIRRKIC